LIVLYGAPTSRRRDAQRNRSAIVQAASEMMMSEQSVVPMPEIARRAGVGQATLYRHFPDRHALTAAVITHHMEQLEAAAAHIEHPTMFRHLLHEVLHTQVAMRPLILLAQRLDPRLRHRYQQRVLAALTPPLRRAQARGHVRPDLVPDDLALMLAMVRGVADAAADVTAARSAAARCIDLVLDGVFRPAVTD
jgi:AcrR family transcriptional regulator